MRSRVIFHANGNAGVWIKCHRVVLSFDDKVVLQNSDELSDKHMKFAQKLKRNNFFLSVYYVQHSCK